MDKIKVKKALATANRDNKGKSKTKQKNKSSIDSKRASNTKTPLNVSKVVIRSQKSTAII